LGDFEFLEQCTWKTEASFGASTLYEALFKGEKAVKRPLDQISQDLKGAEALASGLAALMFTTADVVGMENKRKKYKTDKDAGEYTDLFTQNFAILRERTPDARDNAAELQKARQKNIELRNKLNNCETRLSQITDL